MVVGETYMSEFLISLILRRKPAISCFFFFKLIRVYLLMLYSFDFYFWLIIVMEHLSVSHIMKSTEIQRGKIILSFCLQRAHVLSSKSSFHPVLFCLVKKWRVCTPRPCPAYWIPLQVIVLRWATGQLKHLKVWWLQANFISHILRCHFHHIQELLPFTVTLNIVMTQTTPPSITNRAPSD